MVEIIDVNDTIKKRTIEGGKDYSFNEWNLNCCMIDLPAKMIKKSIVLQERYRQKRE